MKQTVVNKNIYFFLFNTLNIKINFDDLITLTVSAS